MAIQQADRIPTAIIGLLSKIFPARYTQAGVESLFLTSGAPEPIPDGSKATKVQAWLRQTNGMSPEPLKVLGLILDDFMEMPFDNKSFWPASTDSAEKLETEKVQIRETLSRDGLTYRPFAQHQERRTWALRGAAAEHQYQASPRATGNSLSAHSFGLRS